MSSDKRLNYILGLSKRRSIQAHTQCHYSKFDSRRARSPALMPATRLSRGRDRLLVVSVALDVVVELRGNTVVVVVVRDSGILVGVVVLVGVLGSSLRESLSSVVVLVLVEGKGLGERVVVVVVLVEVLDVDAELVAVGVGNLNVVLVGENVAVGRLGGTETEALTAVGVAVTTTGQVGVLVVVHGLGGGNVVVLVVVLIGVVGGLLGTRVARVVRRVRPVVVRTVIGVVGRNVTSTMGTNTVAVAVLVSGKGTILCENASTSQRVDILTRQRQQRRGRRRKGWRWAAF